MNLRSVPSLVGLNVLVFGCLGFSMSLQELSSSSHFYCLITWVYGCTVVQDQRSIVALYGCITSLPVYPRTIHGHCIIVLDTSNVGILHCTTLKVQTVYCRSAAAGHNTRHQTGPCHGNSPRPWPRLHWILWCRGFSEQATYGSVGQHHKVAVVTYMFFVTFSV